MACDFLFLKITYCPEFRLNIRIGSQAFQVFLILLYSVRLQKEILTYVRFFTSVSYISSSGFDI